MWWSERVLAAARATKHQGLLATRDLGQLRQGIRARTDPKLRRERQLAVAGLHLPELPERSRQEGSVWAVTMVRNEADVIGDTVQHLLDQGVAGILVADNGSVDGTAQVIRGLNDARVYLVDDREPAFFQAAKLTELARRAAGAGADWIVPFDGDEFWFGLEGSLIDSLRSLASPIAVAHVHNAFPSPEGGGWRLDTSPARLQKVAFRWHRLAYLHHGNHAVFRPGRPTERLRVLHTPWRSFEQFERKIRLGAAAMDLARGRRTDSDTGGDHWRDLALLDDADLRTAWSDLLNGRAPEIMEWIPRGELRECHWRHARQWAEIWSQVSDEGATRK